MRNLVIFTNLTLDGVMQAPGRPDEDRRGGFAYGGWAAPYAAMSSPEAGESLPSFGALLLQTLITHGLVDRYVLLIHPLVLGSGRRLFPDGSASTALRLVTARTMPSGVIVATYAPNAPRASERSG